MKKFRFNVEDLYAYHYEVEVEAETFEEAEELAKQHQTPPENECEREYIETDVVLLEDKMETKNRKYIRVFTTAPKDYDYGPVYESRIVGTFGVGEGKQLPVRELFVFEEIVDQQIARNHSGLYSSWTEETAREEMKYPYLKIEM